MDALSGRATGLVFSTIQHVRRAPRCYTLKRVTFLITQTTFSDDSKENFSLNVSLSHRWILRLSLDLSLGHKAKLNYEAKSRLGDQKSFFMLSRLKTTVW